MPFQFERGRYSLLPSEFVWGFDSGNPTHIRPSRTSDRHIDLGRSLQAAVARVGWDVEDFDVVVEVTQAKNGQCFRFVSEITGAFQGEPFTMIYRIGTEDASDGISSNEVVKFSHGATEIYLDEDPSTDDLRHFTAVATGVIARLSTFPADEGDDTLSRLCATQLIPVPHISPTLYCWLSPDQWKPRTNGAVVPGGERALLPFGIGNPEHKAMLHPRANAAFNFATVNPAIRGSNGLHEPSREALPVEISLKALNEIYVIDAARTGDLTQCYSEVAEKIGRTQPTEFEFSDFMTATARTMTPVTEYRGGFENPVYLIGRQLNSNEARRIIGNIEVFYDGATLRSSLIDNLKGRKILIHETNHPTLGDMETALNLASRLSSLMGTEKFISDKLLFEVKSLQKHRYASYLEDKAKTGERSKIMDILMSPNSW
jgi:hypothetical protein